MNNYSESKKELDRIRSEYGCQGEVLFRTAIQMVVEYGTSDLLDDYSYEHMKHDVNERHDAAEADGKVLWITRDFELALLECAREIASVNIYDMLMYIQKEVWLSGNYIEYQRAMKLLKKCMEQIEADEGYDNAETLYVLQSLGFTDEEVEELEFGYLLNNNEEEE